MRTLDNHINDELFEELNEINLGPHLHRIAEKQGRTTIQIGADADSGTDDTYIPEGTYICQWWADPESGELVRNIVLEPYFGFD